MYATLPVFFSVVTVVNQCKVTFLADYVKSYIDLNVCVRRLIMWQKIELDALQSTNTTILLMILTVFFVRKHFFIFGCGHFHGE